MPDQTTESAPTAAAAADAPKAENHIHYLIREGVHALRNELDRIGPMAKADYLKLLAEVHKLIDLVEGERQAAPAATPVTTLIGASDAPGADLTAEAKAISDKHFSTLWANRSGAPPEADAPEEAQPAPASAADFGAKENPPKKPPQETPSKSEPTPVLPLVETDPTLQQQAGLAAAAEPTPAAAAPPTPVPLA